MALVCELRAGHNGYVRLGLRVAPLPGDRPRSTLARYQVKVKSLTVRRRGSGLLGSGAL